ncbi:anti-Muellerian hormone type-2 receptor-like [Synchiropus splendidus]|uniref:anti-Muellerian hormone type-2 receptor-like n=1 Tax=Synchiropus splendidus TaxID=270530 RepID=UPI00237D4AD4|nr:anti-Muellerian hormone type-2 receptor-like [Synchiropus splendidus]
MIQRWWLLVLTVVSISSSLSLQNAIQKRQCAFKLNTLSRKFAALGNVSGSVQTCEHTNCCVGYFLLVDGRPEVDQLACDYVEKSCPEKTCIGQSSYSKRVIKCACNTDLCNAKLVWSPAAEEPPVTDSLPLEMIAVVVIGILVAVSLGLVAARLSCMFQQRKRNPKSSCHHSLASPLCSCWKATTSEIDISKIEAQQIVATGHFSAHWKGLYRGSTVAVKVFPPSRKHRFLREKEVYELPLMKHAAIAHFLGTGGKTGTDGTSWFVVLRSTDHGSLHSFLSEHTNNWMMSLRLCRSLSLGLSFLHSDLHQDGLHKPPVAHRNLSGFSILVKVDGTCALCDFECSTILRRCSWRFPLQTRSEDFQRSSLSYLSPEVLEGSVNLSGSWCLQADVYGLALLLWEIFMRCSDMFEGGEVPVHVVPYESELGPNMTVEQLTWHVLHQEQRPSIPQHWGSDMRALLMECWEPDPDARLTAPCVVDRLATFESPHIPSVSPNVVG